MVAMVTPTTGTTNMVVKGKSSSSKEIGKGRSNADDNDSPSGTVPLRRSTRRRNTIKRLLVNDDDQNKGVNSNYDGSDKEEKNDKVKHEQEETVSVPESSSPTSTKTTEVPVVPEAPLSSSNFEFRGKSYETYEAMVKAKRQFNQRKMLDMGLMDAVENVHEAAMQEKKKKAAATSHGLKKRKDIKPNDEKTLEPVRQSKRLRGVKADNRYIEEERGRTFTFGQDGTTARNDNGDEEEDATSQQQIKFMKDRVCDAGESLTIKQAIDQAQDSSNGKFAKWVGSSVEEATEFLKIIGFKDAKKYKQHDEASPKSVATVAVDEKIKKEEAAYAGMYGTSAVKYDNAEDVKVQDEEQEERERELPSAFSEDCVAKVTPDRIYGICCHPSKDKIIVAAGDKQGYLGLWNATAAPSSDEATCTGTTTAIASTNSTHSHNNVHLFQPHSRPINHLEWNTDGTALYSISYDSSIRKLDFATQTFEEVFATYDDSSPSYKKYPGCLMDQGYKFWIQNGTLLPSRSDRGMWFCTSLGTVVELDLRSPSKTRIVNHVQVSDKKVNTISVSNHTIATGGLDTSIKVWDVRNFSSNTKNIVDAWTPTTKSKAMLTQLQYPKSINSAYFSPNGSKLLVTTMSNVIDIHDTNTLLSTSKGKPAPLQRIPHDNHTGRWLSTFMAQWNSNGDEFVVGSMTHPRRMDLFSTSSTSDTTKYERHSIVGEYMTSVSSRCCFHPNSSKLIICGGNSSGRVTVAR